MSCAKQSNKILKNINHLSASQTEKKCQLMTFLHVYIFIDLGFSCVALQIRRSPVWSIGGSVGLKVGMELGHQIWVRTGEDAQHSEVHCEQLIDLVNLLKGTVQLTAGYSDNLFTLLLFAQAVYFFKSTEQVMGSIIQKFSFLVSQGRIPERTECSNVQDPLNFFKTFKDMFCHHAQCTYIPVYTIF